MSIEISALCCMDCCKTLLFSEYSNLELQVQFYISLLNISVSLPVANGKSNGTSNGTSNGSTTVISSMDKIVPVAKPPPVCYYNAHCISNVEIY